MTLRRSIIAFTFLLHLLSQTCFAGDTRRHGPSFSPDYVLVATAEDTIINCQRRHSIVFNGTTPGPALHFKENQTSWVRVHNHLRDDNLTVHWHGLALRTAPFSDGTPLVSQWPIAPGAFFDYEVRPEMGDAGTYFYHSHVGFQAVTAYGALVVRDARAPPYDYDEDVAVVTLGDYFDRNDTDIVEGLLANPLRWSGEPHAVVFAGRSGNASFDAAPDESCTPKVITVQPGKTYRMRFAACTALSLVTLALEGHDDLTIIEADGRYTKPVSARWLQLGAGQRYSILLRTKTAAEIAAGGGKTKYWIRYETRGRPVNVTGYALLEYDVPGMVTLPLPRELPAQSPVSMPGEEDITYWMEYKLEPLLKADVDAFPRLGEVTRTVYIDIVPKLVNGVRLPNGTLNATLEWTQNTLAWQENALAAGPYQPLLVSIYTTGKTPDMALAQQNRHWDPTMRAFPAMVGEVLDIVWQGSSGDTGSWDLHPMHGHGAHFWDLGSGNGTYDAVANEDRHFRGSFAPARRDTTMLYRYATKGDFGHVAGWRAWRVRVTEDTVGAWMMHCHILQHMVMGMQTAWVFGNAEQILRRFPQQPYVQGYLTYGGSAYGNASFDPLVHEFFRT